jgi:pilus assembly protein Flp/PilA
MRRRDARGVHFLSFSMIAAVTKVADDPQPLLETSMKSLANSVRRFLVSEDGPTAVEYAVMLALIVIVCLTAISTVGTNAQQTFNDVANQLGTGS